MNGVLVVKHEIGHLPFEADITDTVKYGEENRITVLCDNALLQNTVPQGKIVEVQRFDDRSPHTSLNLPICFCFFINEMILCLNFCFSFVPK